MRPSLETAAALGLLLLSACAHRNAPRSGAGIQSVVTSLAPDSCEQQVDRNDPNETPYLVCSGVAGYSLIERLVESGRESIDVVDPSQHTFPLNYQDLVTPAMSALDPRAEWRVQTKDDTQVPIALIVRVQAHEDISDPARVTRTLAAVAKITPGQACVVASIPDTGQSASEIRSAADSAREKPCLRPASQ